MCTIDANYVLCACDSDNVYISICSENFIKLCKYMYLCIEIIYKAFTFCTEFMYTMHCNYICTKHKLHKCTYAQKLCIHACANALKLCKKPHTT